MEVSVTLKDSYLQLGITFVCNITSLVMMPSNLEDYSLYASNNCCHQGYTICLNFVFITQKFWAGWNWLLKVETWGWCSLQVRACYYWAGEAALTSGSYSSSSKHLPNSKPWTPCISNHIRHKKPWKHLPNSLHRIKRLETSNNLLSHVRIPHVDWLASLSPPWILLNWFFNQNINMGV